MKGFFGSRSSKPNSSTPCHPSAIEVTSPQIPGFEAMCLGPNDAEKPIMHESLFLTLLDEDMKSHIISLCSHIAWTSFDEIFGLPAGTGYGAVLGQGGMNNLRRANKKLRASVEAIVTRLELNPRRKANDGLMNPSEQDHLFSESLPVALLARCPRIQEIIECTGALKTLKGIPPGLKRLEVYGPQLKSIAPLSVCTALESFSLSHCWDVKNLTPLSHCTSLKILKLEKSNVSNLSALKFMPLLEELNLEKSPTLDFIVDFAPIASCSKLRRLNLSYAECEDLSFLSGLSELEGLDISGSMATSIVPLTGLKKLKKLTIYCVRAEISPLSSLTSLEWLDCRGCRGAARSLLPCANLRRLDCDGIMPGLSELVQKRREIEVNKTRGCTEVFW